MIRTDDADGDPDEPFPTDERYAGFGLEDGYVLYDTENAAAWIESDTTRDLAEVR